MSSHREAPQISKDPVADSTDVYAFVSPDAPDTVTLISNYIPLQGPDGGPNFYEFGDDVLYEINIDNNGDGVADVIYQFQFTTTLRDPSYFLYNVGPITSLEQPKLEQGPDLFPAAGRHARGAGDCPRVRISRARPATSDRSRLRTTRPWPAEAISRVGDGRPLLRRSTGRGLLRRPRSDFRPRQSPAVPGRPRGVVGDGAAGHGGRCELHRQGQRAQPCSPDTDLAADAVAMAEQCQSSVIGVWTTASRQKVKIYEGQSGVISNSGPYVQVSRLGNPLFNEVLIPLSSEGRLERTATVGRQGLRPVRLDAPARDACCRASSRACSPTWPRSMQRSTRAGRPSRHSLDRDPLDRRPGIRRQLHRSDPGGHAPPQHVHPSDATPQLQQSRFDRRRRCRLPQRPSRSKTTWRPLSSAPSPGRHCRSSTPRTCPMRRGAGGNLPWASPRARRTRRRWARRTTFRASPISGRPTVGTTPTRPAPSRVEVETMTTSQPPPARTTAIPMSRRNVPDRATQARSSSTSARALGPP